MRQALSLACLDTTSSIDYRIAAFAWAHVGRHRSAGSIHCVGEVLEVDANPSPLPVLKLPWVDELPLAHSPQIDSTDALMHPMARCQVSSEKLLISSGQNPFFGGCESSVDASW